MDTISLEIFDILDLETLDLVFGAQACPILWNELFGLGVWKGQFIKLMPLILRVFLDFLGNFGASPHKET